MRKLIIRLFALNYYYKIFGRLVNIPRAVAWIAVTFGIGVLFSSTSLTYSDNIFVTALYWLPFGLVVLFSKFYLPAKSVNYKTEKHYLDFTQRHDYLGIQVTRNNNLDYEDIYRDYQIEFKKRYGELDQKFAAFASVGSVLLFLIIVAYIFYKFYIHA